jgi:hypothetical protein
VRVYRSGHELIADIATWSDEQLASMPAARRADGVAPAGPILSGAIAAALERRLAGVAAQGEAVRTAAQALAEDAAIGVAYRKPPWQEPLLAVLGRV